MLASRGGVMILTFVQKHAINFPGEEIALTLGLARPATA